MNLPPHHLESLGWTLIHFCWQAAVIALSYKIADHFILRDAKKPPSHLRYLLALVALLGMFAAAAGTFVYEEFRLQRSFVTVHATDSGTIDSPAGVLSSTTLNSDLTASVVSALPRTETLLPWLDALWMLGVFALSARTVGGWLLLQRLRASATQQIPPALAASFQRIAELVGVQGRVALRLSTRIASPLAVGMVRSLILLPASALTTLTAEQLESVIAHELAHIRRADYLWNIVQTMIETLFFFHPAVWWVGSQLRQQRELCCDDIAIASCSDPLVYATALLALEEHRARLIAHHTSTSGLPLALALDGHQSPFTLRSRIARILGEPMQVTTSPRTLAPFSILGVCAALALFAMPVPRVLASLRPAKLASASLTATTPTAPVILTTPTTPTAATAPTAPSVSELPTPAAPASSAAAPVVAPTPRVEPSPVASPRPAVAPAPLVSPAPVAEPAPVPTPHSSVLGVEILRALSIAAKAGSEYAKSQAEYRRDALAQVAMAQTTTSSTTSTSTNTHTPPVTDYISSMRAAGYNEDIDQYMAMKIHGITPEYASQMANVGFGKPSAGELIALRIHGVTPEYLNELKASGIKPESFQDVVAYRIFKVTPEFIAGMKSAGFNDLPVNKLVELRVQNITPEFARTSKQQFPDINVNQLVELRIFHIDDAFIAKAKELGLKPLTVNKLVQLRTSGLLDDQRVRE